MDVPARRRAVEGRRGPSRAEAAPLAVGYITCMKRLHGDSLSEDECPGTSSWWLRIAAPN